MTDTGNTLNSKEWQVSREKYWTELTSDEKIERMRGIVLSLQHQLHEAQNTIFALTMHKHLPDQSLVLEFEKKHLLSEEGYKNRNIGGRLPGQEYF